MTIFTSFSCQLTNIPLTLRLLMSTTVDILRFYWELYNQLLKYAINLETLIYVGP